MASQELIKNVNELQVIANSIYDELGATDEVIDLQAAINQFRSKYDIIDESELTEFNKGFVQ